MIHFDIEAKIPSNNVVMRMHHRERTKAHKYWTQLVIEAVGLYRKPYKKCIVQINRFSPRPLDWDNMAGGCKFLLDALVKANLIEDDSVDCITELKLGQHKTSKKDARTSVIITPV